MTKKKELFTDWDVNLITMYNSSIAPPRYKKHYIERKGNFLKSNELEGYMSAKLLRTEFNVGARKLKDLFVSIGTLPKYHMGATYYSTEYLDRARELIAEKKEFGVIDMTKYISNQELMDMFGFNTFKAWYVASHAKLTKYRFGLNVNYYEREEAIAAFAKHVKNDK